MNASGPLKADVVEFGTLSDAETSLDYLFQPEFGFTDREGCVDWKLCPACVSHTYIPRHDQACLVSRQRRLVAGEASLGAW